MEQKMDSELINRLSQVRKNETVDFRWQSLRIMVKRDIVGEKVLDAGCGTGHLTLDLLTEGYEVTAIDGSGEFINSIKTRAEKHISKLQAYTMNLEDCRKMGEEVFDTVICLDVLEHIENDDDAIDNLKYVLKKKGRMIITVPSLQALYGERDRKIGHFRRYERGNIIRKLAQHQLEVTEIRFWNFLGVVPFFISEKILHKEVNENVRYSTCYLSLLLNRVLFWWFKNIENSIRPPFGLSLFIICKKRG